MSDPYLGEIRLFAAGVVPRGWLPCDGRTLAIQTNAALYSLLGVQFGGDGRTTFMLPDLRGRVIAGAGVSAHSGTVYQTGAAGGVESVTLSTAQMPAHTHPVIASAANGAFATAEGNYFAAPVASTGGGAEPLYANDTTHKLALAPQSIDSAGGGAAHDDMQPSLVLNYCIATAGIYPMRP